MNLYEIDKNLQAAFEACVDPETGEIIDEDKLEEFNQLQMDRDTKIENICLFIKNLKSDATALKAEKDAFASRQKAAEKKAERLTEYLSGYLAGEKFKSEKAVVSYRKSESVSVTDITKIPLEYMTMADPTPNKTAIKSAIKAGDEVPGAEIVVNQNISIR
jgi:hypothetical protein